MRLVLMFYGSRGDIQPGLAFGLELQRRGHDVRMVVPPNYVPLARGLGQPLMASFHFTRAPVRRMLRW